MKLLFSYYINEKIQDKLDTIRKYTSIIERNAEDYRYILGLEYIGIKLIIQDSIEGYEDFIKPQKPRFKKQFIQKNPILGDSSYTGYLTLELLFEQTSYEALLNSSGDAEIKHILKQELLLAEDVFHEMKNKLGNINTAEFTDLIIKALA